MEIREPPEWTSLPRPASACPKTIRLDYMRCHELIEQSRESIASISHINMPKHPYFISFLLLGFFGTGMWDLSSPTRDQTFVPCSGSTGLAAREVPPNIHTLNKYYKEHSGDISDVGLISESGRSSGRGMATHSSILIWEIPESGPQGRKGSETTEAT